jgi:hypothetical protein
VVERDEPRRKTRVDEELPARPVDAVLRGKCPRELEEAEVAVVEAVLLESGQARLVGVDRPDDLVDVGGTVAVVVRIAPQHDPLVGNALGDVVGA